MEEKGPSFQCNITGNSRWEKKTCVVFFAPQFVSDRKEECGKSGERRPRCKQEAAIVVVGRKSQARITTGTKKVVGEAKRFTQGFCCCVRMIV